jgi:hypothetical protein
MVVLKRRTLIALIRTQSGCAGCAMTVIFFVDDHRGHRQEGGPARLQPAGNNVPRHRSLRNPALTRLHFAARQRGRPAKNLNRRLLDHSTGAATMTDAPVLQGRPQVRPRGLQNVGIRPNGSAMIRLGPEGCRHRSPPFVVAKLVAYTFGRVPGLPGGLPTTLRPAPCHFQGQPLGHR